ncbi:hypothetical protein ACWDXV_16615 [Nocardia nova]
MMVPPTKRTLRALLSTHACIAARDGECLIVARFTGSKYNRLLRRSTSFYERFALGWATKFVQEFDGGSWYTLLSTDSVVYSGHLVRADEPSTYGTVKGIDYGDGWTAKDTPGVSDWETVTDASGFILHPKPTVDALNAEALRAIQLAERLRS